jgi:putative ABC transport system permease protein
MGRLSSRGHIKTAIKSVRIAKWRSLFTMMGVIIGIVSVITIVSIGEGVKHQVAQQVNGLSKDLITVRPGHTDLNQKTGDKLNVLTNYSSVGALNDSDYNAVTSTPGVKYAVPLSVIGNTVSTASSRYKGGLVIATNDQLPKVLNQAVGFGAFFSSDELDDNVAVIGKKVAQKLFNQDVPLGNSFTYMGESFVVRGVYDEFTNSPISLDADFNNAVFIPYKTAVRLTKNHASIYEILAQPSNLSNLSGVQHDINANLLNAHGGQQDFSVLKQKDNAGATSNVLNLLTGLIAGIAAISLLVGGIGIMDVMLVSVTERMHEIGIRKAIGATDRQILAQFLTESTVLSVGGGIIGIAVSFIIDFILHMFTSLQPLITWQIVVIAAGVSLLVGIVFGTIPASKAARKDPIDALRND